MSRRINSGFAYRSPWNVALACGLEQARDALAILMESGIGLHVRYDDGAFDRLAWLAGL